MKQLTSIQLEILHLGSTTIWSYSHEKDIDELAGLGLVTVRDDDESGSEALVVTVLSNNVRKFFSESESQS